MDGETCSIEMHLGLGTLLRGRQAENEDGMSGHPSHLNECIQQTIAAIEMDLLSTCQCLSMLVILTCENK